MMAQKSLEAQRSTFQLCAHSIPTYNILCVMTLANNWKLFLSLRVLNGAMESIVGLVQGRHIHRFNGTVQP